MKTDTMTWLIDGDEWQVARRARSAVRRGIYAWEAVRINRAGSVEADDLDELAIAIEGYDEDDEDRSYV